MVHQLRLPLMVATKGHPLKTTRIREEDTIFIRLPAKQRVIPMISDELRERECILRLTNMSVDASWEIVKVTLQHTTMLTVSPCRTHIQYTGRG